MLDSAQEHSITFRDYLRVLFRRKFILFGISLISILIGFIVVTLKTPTYSATVKMLISAQKQVDSPYYKDIYSNNNKNVALTQSEIIKSNPVIERAVRAIGLDRKPLDYEKNFSSPLKRSLIDLNNQFSKTKLNRYPKETQDMLRFRWAVNDLKRNITIEQIRDTNLIQLTATEFDPVGAAVIANVVSRSFIIFDLEQQLAEMSSKYGSKYPVVSQLNTDIQQMIVQLNGKPLSDLDAIGPASVKIIEQATIPVEPSGVTKKKIMVFFALFGLVLGVMIVFIIEYLDQSFYLPQDIENFLNLKVIGSIPMKVFGRKILNLNKVSNNMYSRFHNIIADKLYMLRKEYQKKSILVYSTSSKEGVTNFVINLGINFSLKTKSKILIIEANLREPRFNRYLKLNKKETLVDYLEAGKSLSDVICKVSDNLDVIVADKAKKDPIGILDSKKFNELVLEVKDKYDLVLIDAPNISQFKDAEILSSYFDGVLLVVKEGFVRRQTIQAGLKCFDQKRTKLLGVVLNGRTFVMPKFIYDRV